MKLKIVIRFNQFAIDTLELESGDYEIGRSSENEISINHPSIHRKHGKLSLGHNGWVYQDYSTQKIIALNDSFPVALSPEIDIATEAHTQAEVTGDRLRLRRTFFTSHRSKIAAAFGMALALVAGCLITYLVLRSGMRHSDPNLLLSQVRSKVVEFEKIKDLEALEDYKTYGKFEDSDFRENVGYCTGFLVAPNVVLTASHCLWGSDFLDLQTNFEIRMADNKKFKPQRVLGFDPIRDFLFLEVPGIESYGYLEFASGYKIGQTVYTLGNAHGQGIAIREGIMANETPDMNDPTITYVRYSAGASPGNSGGPLLDTDGRIVAIVFAATGAENYNLGTSCRDLKKGYDQFVKNREPKSISVIARKMFNFNPQLFMQKQLLPFLADYHEHPELSQKIYNMQLKFDVPLSFDTISEKVITEVHQKSATVIDEIEKALLEKGEIILDWASFASAKTPAIHPSQFDSSQNSLYKEKGRYYMKLGGFLDSPSRKDFKQYVDHFEKEKKFDFQAYGMNVDLQLPTEKEPRLIYLPRNIAKSKQNIEDLTQGTLYLQMILAQRIDDPDLIPNFLRLYLGDNGVLSNTWSAFIRPQAFKQFTITALDKKTDKENVKDGRGRQWTRFHFRLFDQFHFYIYCLPLPEATTCVARVIPVENDFRRGLVEESFREHILAHFLENPYFWTPTALSEFMVSPAAAGMTSLQGTTFTKNASGAHSLGLSAFGMQMELPSTLQSVRVQTGLFYNREKKAVWTGYGAEWLTPTQLCGAGVEPLGSQSSFMLNFLRDSLKRLKLKDDDSKKEEIPKLWTEKAATPQGEVQVFGYCAPLRENPMEMGYYFVDFKRAKPMAVKYKVAP